MVLVDQVPSLVLIKQKWISPHFTSIRRNELGLISNMEILSLNGEVF